MTDEIEPKQTFIYDGREFVMTGREAIKKRMSGRERKLVEIRPITVRDPEDTTYNKWVQESDLFHIGEVGE